MDEPINRFRIGQKYAVAVRKNAPVGYCKSLFICNVCLDNVYTYGAVCYDTKMILAIESGMPGVPLREIEERLNTLVSCPNKVRNGKTL